MPTIEENERYWSRLYEWPARGEEWSRDWGGASMQWYGTILPRIHRFVPAPCILEIGCGHGRWTGFLGRLCRRLVAVDIAAPCVEACTARFSGMPHIECRRNDGMTLPMVSRRSVDFVFSFDALVLADAAVIESYLAELGRILDPDGVAFVHHSNLGEYVSASVSRSKALREERDLYWRDGSVSARLVESRCLDHGLTCVSQELIRWGTRRLLIDCLSVIVRSGSSKARENRVLHNDDFGEEAANLQRLATLYA